MTISIDRVADLGEDFVSYSNAYVNDGTLVKGSGPEAVPHDDENIARTVRVVTEARISSAHGADVKVDIEPTLVHGDYAGSLKRAAHLREALENAGVVITPLPQALANRTEVLA